MSAGLLGQGRQGRAVVVVGAGARFFSGVSLYTALLAGALVRAGAPVRVVLARQLCPERLYPGRSRVGSRTTSQLPLPAAARVCDSLDWWPSRGTLAAYLFMWRSRPGALVLQWWTASMLHHYVLFAAMVRLRGGSVVVELHEVQDVSELQVPALRWYGRAGLRLLARLSKFVLVHSEDDRSQVASARLVGAAPVHVVLHGPYPREVLGSGPAPEVRETSGRAAEVAKNYPAAKAGEPEIACGRRRLRLLFFGVVRPYKGLDVLSEALALVSSPVQLTVAGEPWGEDSRRLLRRMEAAGVEVLDSYVDDDVLNGLLERADLVVLPYLRASASGPLAVAMSAGLPVVVSDLASLREASHGYAGVRFAAPGDPRALAAGIDAAADLVGRRFEDPRSWDDTASTVLELLAQASRRGGSSSRTAAGVGLGSAEEESVAKGTSWGTRP